jgi:NAD+ synthase
MVIIMVDFQGNLPKLDIDKTSREISNFIESSLIESKTHGLVLGLSGGLDSSTTAILCSEVVNKDKILGLVMPSRTTTSNDVEDAVRLAEDLGINYQIIPVDLLIEPIVAACRESVGHNHFDMAEANLKARMRMMLLYYHANALNRLVVGTGNRTELLVGYFTKYGDGGVDILPIGGLYKTEVRSIAKHLEVPQKILDKVPTAGLWPGQTDEEELGIKYNILDEILYLLTEKKMKEKETAGKLEISLDEVVKVKMMILTAEHKLETPPIPQIVR